MGKRWFLLMGVSILIFSFVVVGCDNPTSSNLDDGPADGTPWVFENQSSYAVTVYPDEDEYPGQGWKSFNLPVRRSKTIRVDKKYDFIYIKYGDANVVKAEPVSGEDRIIFKNK
jgi:hypothetical protein